MSDGPPRRTGLVGTLVRRRGRVALAWTAVAAALLPLAGRVAAVLEPGAHIPNSESSAVERLQAPGGPLASPYARFAVLVVGAAPSPDAPQGEALLRRIVAPLKAAPGVTGVFSWLDYRDTLLLAAHGPGTYVLVGLAGEGANADRLVPALRELTSRLTRDLRGVAPGLTLRWTGESALNVDLRRSSSRDVSRAERRALPLTLALLLFAFGAFTAAVVPILVAALAIAVALGAATVLAGIWPLSILLESIVPMLGLGLGIDYALLMVSRFREALASGADAETAAVEAGRHAGHTILLSAATVTLGFLVLLLVPLNEMRAIACGGLLVVVAGALLATTLLPGLLATLGARIDWLRVRRRSARREAEARWRAWGERVTGHPWIALVAGSAPMLVLAAQSLRLATGLPRGEWLPRSMESARALHDLDAMGRGGVIRGVRVVLELPAGSTFRREAEWAALARFADALAADPRAARVRSIVAVTQASGMTRTGFVRLPAALVRPLARGVLSEDGRLAMVEAVPRERVTDDDVIRWVREIRAAGARPLGIPGATARVGGLPAFNADYQDAVAGRFLQIAALVVGGTLLALFLGFRSILVPLKAVALNLLSVAAAFGALVLVFQDGHGAAWLGVAEPLGAVFSSLPVIVFAIVFGLSMDYEVFLMGRIMEARRRGLGDRAAIVEGLGTTGRVITSAAAIMLVVFAAFTLGDVLMTKMLGFALAVAVLLDASIVRIVIGPALLQLAGRWNWWPGALAERSATASTSPPADR